MKQAELPDNSYNSSFSVEEGGKDESDFKLASRDGDWKSG